LTEYMVKINHRSVLDGMFAVCGVSSDKIRTISSAIDKLDKLPWEVVRAEMVDEKGLDAAVADRIGTYVKLKGGDELITQLIQDENLTANNKVKEGLNDLQVLFKYLRNFKIADKFSFDLSLARGLDYYTGVIFEVVVAGSAPPVPAAALGAGAPATLKGDADDEVDESEVGYGSIAAGGRYDELVGMFASGGTRTPCVGTSFGVERIFSILSKSTVDGSDHRKAVEVFVMSLRDGLLEERMTIATELQDAGIPAEYLFKMKPSAGHQFEAIERDRIPIAVLIGPDELKEGKVRIKKQRGKQVDSAEDKGVVVSRSEMIPHIKALLEAP